MTFRFVLVWLLVSISGCGTAEIFENCSSDGPPVFVSGNVQFRGYALNGGWIVFIAQGSSEMQSAEIYSDGSFNLNDKGLKPGNYLITVTNHKSAHWGLPSRYSNPQLSGLTCTVKPHQPLRLRIELE